MGATGGGGGGTLGDNLAYGWNLAPEEEEAVLFEEAAPFNNKALGSDVDRLVCVLRWTRSSSAEANRLPQYSEPKTMINILCTLDTKVQDKVKYTFLNADKIK